MYAEMPSCNEPTQIPPRIKAAQDFLNYCCNLQSANYVCEGVTADGRELTKAEQMAYESALDLLTQYFRCELDLGDTPPTPHQPPPDDEGKTKQPVKV